MQNKVKYVLGIVMLTSILGCTPTATKEDTIKIGADYALSGNLARYGTWATNGINLALEELNDQGGVNGKQIEVIFEDSKGQPAEAVSAYHKLKDVDEVNYVITFQSSIALAVAPLANQDKIIQMDVSATTPDYSTPDDYTFRTGIVATQLATESADILFNNLNVKDVGILFINNDFGQGMVKTFKKSYEGNILIEETFEQDSSDFRTQLAKIKEANTDTILLISHIKEGGLIVKQAKEIGLDADFFTDVYSVEGPEFLDVAQEAAEGIIYVAPKFDIDDKEPTVANFVLNYKQTYNEDPTYFAAQAYDGLLSLGRALESCDYDNTECVQQKIMQLDFEGASGKMNFDENGDVLKPVELKTIKDGEFVKL